MRVEGLIEATRQAARNASEDVRQRLERWRLPESLGVRPHLGIYSCKHSYCLPSCVSVQYAFCNHKPNLLRQCACAQPATKNVPCDSSSPF